MESFTVFCPNHPNATLIEDYHTGDVICPECGLVVGDRIIDVGSEWRYYCNEQTSDPARVGAPESSNENKLFTLIEEHSSHKKLIDAHKRMTFREGRGVRDSANLISEIVDRLNLTCPIKERATKIFKVATGKMERKRQNSDAQAAACVYIACRKEGAPRTIKEICAACPSSSKEISRCFMLINRIIETRLKNDAAIDFIPRLCANLDLPISVQNTAKRIAEKTVKLGLVSGRTPMSLAAASIYMALRSSEGGPDLKKIAEIAGVADITINLTYKDMLPQADEHFTL